MQGTALHAHSATHVLEEGPARQLPLPTGPLGVVRRRERTEEDRAWYTDQLGREHPRLVDKVVFERVAYYASLRPERIAFPSVARLASEVLCSGRTVQRALRRLETAGLISCQNHEGGRTTSRYQVVCHPRGDSVSPEVISEEDQGLPIPELPFGISPKPNCEAGGQRQHDPEHASKEPYRRHKAPPDKARPPNKGKRQLRYWFALQRKLGGWGQEYIQSQGRIFNALPHVQKVQVIDRLLIEERRGVESGSLVAFQAGGRQ